MNIVAGFPSRLQFNADKELVFITTAGFLGIEEEVVVELEHLEIQVPYLNIGTKFMTANDPDGYFILKDMNKNKAYYVNKRVPMTRTTNDTKREAFLRKVTRLWDESVADSTLDSDNIVFEMEGEKKSIV